MQKKESGTWKIGHQILSKRITKKIKNEKEQRNPRGLIGHNEKKSEEDKETECIFKAIMVENLLNKERNKHPDP